MTLATRQERLTRAIVGARGFGEPCTLPTGTVQGVFDLPGGPVVLRPDGTRATGLSLPHQAHPVLHLRSADAAGLKASDAVTIRGVTYRVVRLDEDGAGLTRVALLAPGAETGPRPEWRQWR